MTPSCRIRSGTFLVVLLLLAGLMNTMPWSLAHPTGGHWDSDADIIRLAPTLSPDEGGENLPSGADTGVREKNGVITRHIIHDSAPRWSWTDFVAHIYTVAEPFQHFSVLPPVDGCTSSNLFTPRETSEFYAKTTSRDDDAEGQQPVQQFCDVATNGGFFDPHEDSATYGHCLGPLVSNGKWKHHSPRKNAMFGLGTDPDGKKVVAVGYLNETMLEGYKWHELVSGVGWLVRDGESYIMESLKEENYTTQTSGSGTHFIRLRAPRLALGVDYSSRVVLVAVDGSEPDNEGLSLDELATILVDLGVQSAINLDGGGSVSVFDEDVLVNIPSDTCDVNSSSSGSRGFPHFKCARKVASVICLQDRAKRELFQLTTPTKSESFSRSTTSSHRHSASLSPTKTPTRHTPQPEVETPPPTNDVRPGRAGTIPRSKARLIAIIVLGVVLGWVLILLAIRCYQSKKQRHVDPERGPVEVPTTDKDEDEGDTVELHRI